MKVYVATYEHRHGRDIGVYATSDGAESYRQAIAAQWFDHELGAIGAGRSR
jgi:hypothetical protein